MVEALPTWLVIILMAGVVVVGVIVSLVLGLVFLANRKPKNGPIHQELANLREEMAQLREEVRSFNKAKPSPKSTDITDLG